MNTQRSIRQFIEDSGTDALGRIVADLSDIAVVLDEQGVVRDVHYAGAAPEGLGAGEWQGRPFADTAARSSRGAADRLLAQLRDGGHVRNEIIVHAGQRQNFVVRYGGASLQQGTLLLGRAVEQPGDTDFKTLFEAGAADATPTLLADMLRLGSDPVVMVDDGGRILWANDAFRAAAEISMVGQIEGRFFDDLVVWREATDLSSLMADASMAGTAGPAAATLRGDAGGSMPVSLSVTRLEQAGRRTFGLVARRDLSPTIATGKADSVMPDIAALLDQAGSLPLKGLVRETSDMIERQCLLAALRLSNNNRTAAAKALGISRQALYLKLERFGIGEE